MEKYVSLICTFAWIFAYQISMTQEVPAYHFKLDYNVPESPAFSILDANPTKVMRGASAQELIVQIANNFISNSKQEPGVAADFNPYFAFGGRLKNVVEYRENYLKRLLANTQLSFATTASKTYPNDLLFGIGARVTLVDSRDLLKNKALGMAIDSALMPTTDPHPNQNIDEITKNERLGQAYDRIKTKMKNASGGALSIGWATAGRAEGSVFSADSLTGFRNQVWLSAEYGTKHGLNLLGLGMYRSNVFPDSSNIDELILGAGLRYMSSKVNIGGEFIYSSEHGKLDFGMNLEIQAIPKIILYASVNKETNVLNPDLERFVIKPGIRWNFSEQRNNQP